jgi:hypothetical protein
MIRFTTKSGSVYEIVREDNRFRRVRGPGLPTARVAGKEGGWQQAESIGPVVVGQSVIVVWPGGTPLLPGSSEGIPATITSPVTEINLVAPNATAPDYSGSGGDFGGGASGDW